MVKTTGGRKRRADATVRSKLNVNFLWNIVNQGHKCKRLLLKALDIYKNNVPPGEEKYLFQYSVEVVNKDMKTAVIRFNKRYIEEDGRRILNYVGAKEEDEIKDYSLSLFKDDHKRYNHYNGVVNSEINEYRYAAFKADEDAKRS